MSFDSDVSEATTGEFEMLADGFRSYCERKYVKERPDKMWSNDVIDKFWVKYLTSHFCIDYNGIAKEVFDFHDYEFHGLSNVPTKCRKKRVDYETRFKNWFKYYDWEVGAIRSFNSLDRVLQEDIKELLKSISAPIPDEDADVEIHYFPGEKYNGNVSRIYISLGGVWMSKEGDHRWKIKW